MKQRHLLLLVTGLFFTNLLASNAARSPAQGIYDFPLTFEENRGQADSRFDYVARGPGYGLYLSGDEILFGLRRGSSRQAPAEVLRMRLAGGLPAPSVRPLEASATKSHYYLGNDPAKWLTNVPHYERILYSEVYPGVDLVFYGTPGHLEYDFIVSPGASADQIKLGFDGTDHLSLTPAGDLILKLESGELVLQRPIVYQEGPDGKRQLINALYMLVGPREVAFRVDPYDLSRPLVIDPIVLYSGYLGGIDSDYAGDITTDGSGGAYVTGTTFSSDFPATIGTYNSSTDVFVAKINSQGSSLEWAAYFGGSSFEEGMSIALDSSNQPHFCGYTRSSNIPTAKAAYQGALAGDQDAFYAMLSSTGSTLIYSSYLGGSTEEGFSDEAAYGIDVDSSGLAYVGGGTNTTDLDTTLGAFDTTSPAGFVGGFFDGIEGFITVFDPSMSGTPSLVYSTYLGSEQGGDQILDLALVSAGIVAVTGWTSVEVPGEPDQRFPAGLASPPFPTTTDAFQTTFQGGFTDAFVTHLNTTVSAGSALEYSTFFGSSTSSESGRGIDVLGQDAFVTGDTFASGSGFPTTAGAFQTSSNGSDELFIARFDTSGGSPEPPVTPLGSPSTLIYSTLYGGADGETAAGIAVNSSGEACILADTFSSDVTLANPFQSISNASSGDESKYPPAKPGALIL